jgi:hypothetical protein
MTTAPDQDITRDLAELQRLPEDEQPSDVLDPTCATTGVKTDVEEDDPDADSAA